MYQFVVRDPGNRTDQEADDINRETRRQTPQRLNHSRIVEISSCIFQVDIEDEQRNREGDYTVAERFDSALGHGATLFRLLKRNLTHGHRNSWHRPWMRNYGHSSLGSTCELGGEFDQGSKRIRFHLSHNVSAMDLNGVLRDSQLKGSLLVEHAPN